MQLIQKVTYTHAVDNPKNGVISTIYPTYYAKLFKDFENESWYLSIITTNQL